MPMTMPLIMILSKYYAHIMIIITIILIIMLISL